MSSNTNTKKSAIIIGGGLGGLFCGALLAKEGLAVTVLEKNANIGGGVQSFKRFNESFDTGMHVIGGLRKGQTLYKICDYLGILNNLKIREVDNDCMDEVTYLSDNHNYKIPSGKENFISYFQNLFPEESENVRNYVEKLFQIVDEIGFFYLRAEDDDYKHDPMFYMPADKMIRHYIKDKRLQELLAYMNPLCSGVAGHTPAYIFAIINVLYISGQSRFEGPSEQLASALKSLIEDNGGSVHANSAVTKIEISDKLVKKVVTVSGQEFTADYYISSLHPATLLDLTSDRIFSKASMLRLQSTNNSYSAFCIFIKFKEGAFRYINHPCYCVQDYDKAWEYGDYDGEWPRGFLYLTPCATGQGEYASTMQIVAMMPFSACDRWSDTVIGRRGEDYRLWKEEHTGRIMAKMRLIFPDIDECIERIISSSPLTIRDYYNVPEGAMYGIVKDCSNIYAGYVPIHTKADNLLQTGQNIYLHGCCGVPLTAINTAEVIVGKNTIVDKINKHAANQKQ